MNVEYLQNKLEIYPTKDGTLVFKLKKNTQKISGAAEEKVVFNIIEAAGNKGVWIRDIRSKSQLSTQELTKVLKSLEGKKAIKAVKSVSVSLTNLFNIFNVYF